MFTDEKSCHKFALQIHNLYNKVLAKYLLLPVLAGKKTEGEKFAGAEITYTREVWSQDQQAIQAGTSHYLGTNFSKMYDVTFQNHTNQQSYPHYMSAGITTRILGCLIVVHGDDRGLVLPFAIAPIQIAILTILADKDASVLGYVKKIKKHLGQYRVKIDDSAQSFGYKISEQEVNGTPFSIVVGPKDVQTDAITLIRRDNQVKQVVKIKELKSVLRQAINDYQTALFNKANQHLHDSITIVSNLKEFVDAIAKHQIALAP
jgi:prolyl-tRNA synthetase